MTNPRRIENELGLGPIQTALQVPGTTVTEGREVRYVEDRNDEPFAQIFKRLVRYVNPPLAKDGGALLEGCRLTVPTGEQFQAISYRGDIEGWRRQVTEGAKALHLNVGQIVEDTLTLENGCAYKLSNCKAFFA